MHDAAHLRASDEDRERTVEALRRHCGEGRLTVDELDERMGAAFAARTMGELAALLDDLPEGAVAPAAPPPPAPPVRVAPGRVPFSVVAELKADPGTVRLQALEYVAPVLSNHGYRLISHTDGTMVFEASRRPPWTIVLAIGLFPFGLLALLITEEHRVDLDFSPTPGGGTRLLAQGVAPEPVRRSFIALAG